MFTSFIQAHTQTYKRTNVQKIELKATYLKICYFNNQTLATEKRLVLITKRWTSGKNIVNIVIYRLNTLQQKKKISFLASLLDKHVSPRMFSCRVVCNKFSGFQVGDKRTIQSYSTITHLPFSVEESHLSPLIPGLNERRPNWINKSKVISIFTSNCSGRQRLWQVKTFLSVNLIYIWRIGVN